MSQRPRKDLLLLLALFAVIWLVVRELHGGGWTASQSSADGLRAPCGVQGSPMDNLSYLAWIQQARYGAVPFANLYAVEPHDPLLINLFFLLVGKLSALLASDPVLLFNLFGFVASMLTPALLYYACIERGMGRRGSLLCSIFVIFGSGVSWVNVLAAGLTGTDLPVGADLLYTDMIPATAFAAYPYHSVGLVLVAALLLLCSRGERRLLEGASGLRWLPAVFALSFLLAGTRPYEPIAFLAVYSVYSLYGLRHRDRRSAVRIAMLAVLALAIVPWTVYHYWVSSQPVWAIFAERSLDLPRGRWFWLLGFGLFWPAAVVDLYLTFKRRAPGRSLVAFWVIGLLLLLLVVDTSMTKLASAGFLALAISAGSTGDRVICWLGSLRRRRLRISGYVAGVLLIIATAVSPFLAYTAPVEAAPKIDIELLPAIRAIRGRARGPRPAVLTDLEAGVLLPGLGGMRVHVGHWALTPEPRKRSRELGWAGLLSRRFRPLSPRLRQLARRRVLRLLRQGRYRFLLVNRAATAHTALTGYAPLTEIYRGKRWVAYEVAGSI